MKLIVKNSLLIVHCFILLTITYYLLPINVSAHLVGQPPFFKVNGQYSNLYPVPLTSLYNFDMPQDLAPENYLVNQPINFEFVTDRLPAPADIVQKTKFYWDFTDGNHGEGLKQTHTFTHIGSYIIKINADDGTTPKPQLLESILVNVLPDKDYRLPRAVILINNQSSKDPLTDILTADFKDQIYLDGSKSTAQNHIVEYFWDFGDQKSAFGVNQTHVYTKDLSQTFPVLRVKDENGFLADNYVEIQNSQNENQLPSTPSAIAGPLTQQPSAKKPNQLPYTIGVIIALITAIFMVRKFVLVRHHGKHQ